MNILVTLQKSLSSKSALGKVSDSGFSVSQVLVVIYENYKQLMQLLNIKLWGFPRLKYIKLHKCPT